MRKFRRAQAQNQASIAKHLSEKSIDSSSDDENDATNEALQEAVNKTLSSYQFEGGDSEKALSYLTEAFQSGGAVCLICISSVKKIDPIWSCSTCYSFMHLSCIQHWIRDSLSYKHEKGINPLWACPKCRTEYPESVIPKKYECFCGKVTDPQHQPWAIPHSCGETCQKPLKPFCGHNCILLCHPGPCPPCPKMVTTSCYCGKQSPKPRRCNAKSWSCQSVCNKSLPSCNHLCTIECHSGICPPCSREISASCYCGSSTKTIECFKSNWKCDKKCENLLPCKIHVCEGLCHRPGDCGECPTAKNRTCPCGKKTYNVSCKQKIVPTCGDTCGKLLDCGAHFCNNRCHPEKCGQCLEVVNKTCRCESFTKETPCIKEFHCNKKCTQIRQCGRHPCNKKCCDCLLKNNFNVCEKICDNNLNCRKHKCSAPCHSGPCYPCPRTVVIQCRCGNSKITVPCGTKKRIKPPPCNKFCKIPPICHHAKQVSHKCHQGDCPPCKKICKMSRKKCEHECVAVCHTKVWVKVKIDGSAQPAGPWEILRERLELQTFPCPPCEFSVMVTCLGGHETKPWPCHKAIPSSCGRECGQLLPCSNHKCELPCHVIGDEKCMDCEFPCLAERIVGCTHVCSKPCHPAPCPPCKQIVKIPCHCGINSLYKRCFELTSAKGKVREEMLKCGNQCPKMYSCGHRCVDNCHFGECRDSINCNKRIKLNCKCQRIKKSFLCTEIQKGAIKIECNQECIKLKSEKEKARENELAKKKKEEELKNLLEVERFEKKFRPKKRGRRDFQYDEGAETENLKTVRRAIFIGIMFLSIAAITYFMTDCC